MNKHEILKRNDNGEIRVVKFVKIDSNKATMFFLGIGDVIKHYGETAEIVEFKIDRDKKISFRYKTLAYDSSTMVIIPSMQLTGHYSSLDNITEQIKNDKESKEVFDQWWALEQERRAKLPRFMCLMDYPKSQYEVGQIYEAFDRNNYMENKGLTNFFEKYPNIFKRVSQTMCKAADIGVI